MNNNKCKETGRKRRTSLRPHSTNKLPCEHTILADELSVGDILLLIVVLMWLSVALADPLDPIQHAALMKIYDGMSMY
jgi:hypothetical protein